MACVVSRRDCDKVLRLIDKERGPHGRTATVTNIVEGEAVEREIGIVETVASSSGQVHLQAQRQPIQRLSGTQATLQDRRLHHEEASIVDSQEGIEVVGFIHQHLVNQ